MLSSVFESIMDNSQIVHAFAASIQVSSYHWHKEYEMIAVLRGSISLYIKSEKIILKKGDVYLVNPKTIHAIRNEIEEENLCIILQIRPEQFSLEKREEGDICFYLDSTSEEVPIGGFKQFFVLMCCILYEMINEDKHASFRVRAYAAKLIADLYDKAVYDIRFQNALSESGNDLMTQLIDFLENHMEEQEVLDSVCRQLGLSRKTLDRTVKNAIGMTGKELLEELRVERAKNLLKNSSKNMNAILDSCGFGSEKTFYRVFREHTGITPKEFRQNRYVEALKESVQGYLDYERPELMMILTEMIQQEGGLNEESKNGI